MHVFDQVRVAVVGTETAGGRERERERKGRNQIDPHTDVHTQNER